MPDPKAKKPEPPKPINLDRQLDILRFGRCGTFLLGGGLDGTVRRWDTTGPTLTDKPPMLGHNGWVQALAVHPDGKRAFSADTWGEVRAWPYADETPKPLWAVKTAHEGFVRQLAVSPDGKTVASCGRDARLRLWDADSGKPTGEFTHPDDVFSLAFHPDNKSIVTGDLRGVVRQWDLTTKKAVREFDFRLSFLQERMQEVGGVRSLAFDPVGNRLLAAGAVPKGGSFVEAIPLLRVFDWAKGEAMHTLQSGAPKDGYVHDAHWHADGFVMAVTSGQPGNGQLLFWRPGEDKPFFASPAANSHSLAVHPTTNRLVVLSTNGNSSGNGRVTGANKEYPGNYAVLLLAEADPNAKN